MRLYQTGFFQSHWWILFITVPVLAYIIFLLAKKFGVRSMGKTFLEKSPSEQKKIRIFVSIYMAAIPIVLPIIQGEIVSIVNLAIAIAIGIVTYFYYHRLAIWIEKRFGKR